MLERRLTGIRPKLGLAEQGAVWPGWIHFGGIYAGSRGGRKERLGLFHERR